MPLTPWPDQRTPALAIVARGDQIRDDGAGRFTVQSQSRPGTAYAATRDSCTCAFAVEGRACMHQLAVRFMADLKAGPVAEVERVRCPTCKAQAIHYGVRLNKSGPVKLYLCKPCGNRFSGREGFHNMRSNPKTIALALDLYFRGLSVRKVADHLGQVHGLEVGHATVYRWVAHYSKMAAAWMDTQKVQTGARWHIDETVVKVNGEARYLWNVLDADSRFLLATHVSKNRDVSNTRAPIAKAKAVASQRPTEVFTDGMKSYQFAVGKELATRHAPNGQRNPHRRVPSIRAPESNNRIERLHGSEKERTKVMRGFDNDKGAAALAEGFRVHYNLVRDHMTLGKTPGEAAGLPNLKGFRWQAIIEAATRNETPKENAA